MTATRSTNPEEIQRFNGDLVAHILRRGEAECSHAAALTVVGSTALTQFVVEIQNRFSLKGSVDLGVGGHGGFLLSRMRLVLSVFNWITNETGLIGMVEVSKNLSDLTQEQQDVLINYLRANFLPVKGINGSHSAYGLKQRFSGEHFYVSQEQFMQAMERAGFISKPVGNGNACFNISKRSPYFKK